MNQLETHERAWDRVYWFKKLAAKRGHSWMKDKDCPIRMRGYSELVFGDLDPKLRKKVDSALKRGYALERRSGLRTILDLVCRYNPIQKFPIGYLGKSEFELYLPTEEAAVDLRQEILALNTMTESFRGKNDRFTVGGRTKYGYTCLSVYWIAARNVGKHDSHPQLRPCFTKMRPAIDEYMAQDAAVREQVARWCNDDDLTIRIPFDSHKERRK